ISLRTLDYIPLAKDSVHTTEAGKKMLKIVSAGEGGSINSYITEGETKNIGGTKFSFNKPVQGTVQLTGKEGPLMITLPHDGEYVSMRGQQVGAVTDSALLARHSGKLKASEIVPLDH